MLVVGFEYLALSLWRGGYWRNCHAFLVVYVRIVVTTIISSRALGCGFSFACPLAWLYYKPF